MLEAPQAEVVAFPNGQVRICAGASDLMFGPPSCLFGPRAVSFFHNVLVVASSHPARTRALLGPDWPKQICVVRSTYSRPFVNRVRERVLGLLQPMSQAARYGWVTGAGGYGVNAHGETTISLQAMIETPQLRAFLRRLPRGIVTVESEFQPVGYA